MLKKDSHPTKKTFQIEMVLIDNLVPQDHLLRVIDKHLDLSFIREKARPYYSEKGRPAIDPVLLFKMMLIGYLYGIRSERRLEQEIICNTAYRWYLGLGLTDSVPDHSTISFNRKNRFKETNVFQEIFDEVVRMAIENKMVGGRIFITDSTHIQANASKNKYTMQVVTNTPADYLQELDLAVNEDRDKHDKPPLPPEEKKETTIHKSSTTDPDSGWLNRKGKPETFAYLDHRTVDHKYNIITDVFVTAGNVNDSEVYIERFKRQMETFDFNMAEAAVLLDSGYMTPYICKELLDAGVLPVIAERKAATRAGTLPKEQFTYDATRECYVCPKGEGLSYSLTNRQGYQLFQSDANHCAKCPVLDACTSNKSKKRAIQRHVWEWCKEKVTAIRHSALGETLYPLRQRTIERSFADAKELHGLRRCRMRGKEKVQEQVLMTAVAQNLKTIAKQLARQASALFSHFISCFYHIHVVVMY
jgi:transposase